MSLKNPVTPPGIDPGTVRLVAQRLNHYITPGPTQSKSNAAKHTRVHSFTSGMSAGFVVCSSQPAVSSRPTCSRQLQDCRENQLAP